MGDLRSDLERIGHGVEPSADAFERLERRRRTRDRNRRLTAGGLALLVAVGGSVAAYSALRNDGAAGIVVGSSGPSRDELAPTVASVRCDGTSTVVETQVVEIDPQTGDILATSSAVRPQPDGVHVLVTNTSDMDLSFQWDLGGDNAPIGAHELVLELPPGTAQVRCQDPSKDAGLPGGYAALRIVDPDGVYVPMELACSEVTGWSADFAPGAIGDPDPVQSAKEHVKGLEPGDVVESAGYPDSEIPHVRVVRDGEVVAVLEYFSDGQGGWLESGGSTCIDGLG
ncbi:MAG: hypothetical protein ACM3WR_06925 [Solirubrobacterales bacterium]